MGLEVGLFISDDPDDYQVFQEAIDEISKDMVLINIGDSEKALRYLRQSDSLPDYLFIDLTMQDSYAKLLKELSTDGFSKIQKVALTDGKDSNGLDPQFYVINKAADFGSLKGELTRFFKI